MHNCPGWMAETIFGGFNATHLPRRPDPRVAATLALSQSFLSQICGNGLTRS